ncbi:MAG: hypothetical protein R2716_05685 [Microthrixaceae bacterium]
MGRNERPSAGFLAATLLAVLVVAAACSTPRPPVKVPDDPPPPPGTPLAPAHLDCARWRTTGSRRSGSPASGTPTTTASGPGGIQLALVAPLRTARRRPTSLERDTGSPDVRSM